MTHKPGPAESERQNLEKRTASTKPKRGGAKQQTQLGNRKLIGAGYCRRKTEKLARGASTRPLRQGHAASAAGMHRRSDRDPRERRIESLIVPFNPLPPYLHCHRAFKAMCRAERAVDRGPDIAAHCARAAVSDLKTAPRSQNGIRDRQPLERESVRNATLSGHTSIAATALSIAPRLRARLCSCLRAL